MNRRAGRHDPEKSANVLGVTVSGWRVDDLIDFAVQRSDAHESRRVTMLYANVHVLNTAYNDPLLHSELVGASTVYCDGSGVRVGAWILGHDLPARMTGADWIDVLCRRAAVEGRSLFFLGGQPGVAARSAQILMARHPGLKVAGSHHGFAEETDSEPIEAINRSGASILLIGMGSPRQERWIGRHRQALRPQVVWAVGALFDFVAGIERRGPRWMLENHLEWAARLEAKTGTHWRRYLIGNPLFIVRVLRQRFFGLKAPGASLDRR